MNAPPPPDRAAGALEALPHLMNKICLMWGSPELDVFITRLLMDSRDGKRQGLPVAVTEEVMDLAEINKLVRAIDLARTRKIPFREARLKVEADDAAQLEKESSTNPLAASAAFPSLSESERRGGSDRRQTHPSPARDPERRSAAERRQATTASVGPVALFGQLVFKLVTSKIVIFIIIVALAIKLIWPYLHKTAS